MLGVLWPALDAECETFAAMPKSTWFLVKESSTHGAGVRIIPADIVEHVSVLNGFRERDGMFAALPEKDDIFGELHTTRRVSPSLHLRNSR